MRIAFVALFLSMVGACGGGGSSEKDLAMSHVDMTAPSGDMSGQTCAMLALCGEGCAGDVTCENACAAKGSTTAQQQYNALFGCAYGVCTAAGDSGTAACASNTDSSQGCSNCVDAAAQSATCSAQFAACGL
jgi:hypothetical protein